MKLKKGFQLAYLIVGFLVALEFIFLRGMFTWLIAVAAVVIVGAVNVILSAKDKEWLLALLYVLCTLSLCMGYLILLG